MSSTSQIPCSAIDNTLGPHAGQCRGGLDFTLFFEEVILTVLPLVFLLCVAPARILYLSKRSTKVNRGLLLWAKAVSFPFKTFDASRLQPCVIQDSIFDIYRH